MAYCVQCGVELAPSEPKCPLCGVPVLNPVQPWQEPDAYPYPVKAEVDAHPINRRFGAYLATVILSVPMALTLLIDLFEGGALSWSPYVLGAGACVFAISILPFYLRPEKPYLCLSIDVLTVGGYLALIGYMSGQADWVAPLGLPLTAILGGGMMLAVYRGRRKNKALLNLLGDIALILAAALIAMEIAIDRYLTHEIHLTWSLIALAPLMALNILFRIIERNQALKDSILKKLYV